MSERYAKLFSLPGNLYATGAPVIIAAGNLLKDTQTGRIVAQLKLQSISDRRIRAAKVRLELFDTAGNALGQSVEYDYLDLNAGRDDAFGQKNPIPLPDTKTRRYTPRVTEAVFDDLSVWTGSDTDWLPLGEPRFLHFGDSELLRQYKFRFGQSSIYQPREERDLWLCTCGAWNHPGETCHVCGNTLFELETLDMAELAGEKDARLAKEREQAAREQAAAEARKKRMTRLLVAGVAVVAAAVLTKNLLLPLIRYNKAVAKMEAGQYAEAIQDFEALEGFWHSEDQILACRDGIREDKYQAAAALMRQEAYDDALTVFLEIEDYRDSEEQIAQCRELSVAERYKHGLELMEDGKFQAAKEIFQALEGYQESDALIEQCDWHLLEAKAEQAAQLAGKEQYAQALVLYREVQDGGMDVSEQIRSCELGILDTAGILFVTSGEPSGTEAKVYASTEGNVTVHSLTRVALDNGCTRFTLDCTAPKCPKMSVFSPPSGKYFKYLAQDIQHGRQTIIFDVPTSALRSSGTMTIKFIGTNSEDWIFTRNLY